MTGHILNKGVSQIDAILFYFSKALDVVTHYHLLVKLYM